MANTTVLKAALKAAYQGVSNDSTLTQDQAQTKLSNDTSAAIDAFVSGLIPDHNSGPLGVVIQNQITLLKELLKLRIDIGTNLDDSKLNSLIQALESL